MRTDNDMLVSFPRTSIAHVELLHFVKRTIRAVKYLSLGADDKPR